MAQKDMNISPPRNINFQKSITFFEAKLKCNILFDGYENL